MVRADGSYEALVMDVTCRWSSQGANNGRNDLGVCMNVGCRVGPSNGEKAREMDTMSIIRADDGIDEL